MAAPRLTQRELEVVRLRALGMPMDAIAQVLRISKTTATHHRTAAQDKYGANGFLDLLAKMGWLVVPE